MKHFLDLRDLSKDKLFELIELTGKMKSKPGNYSDKLSGKSLLLLFDLKIILPL